MSVTHNEAKPLFLVAEVFLIVDVDGGREMKIRIGHWLPPMSVMLLVVVLTGCGKGNTIVDQEEVPLATPEMMNDASGKSDAENDVMDSGANRKVDGLDGNILGNSLEDYSDAPELPWNDNIPDVFPVNKWGKCVVSQYIQEEIDLWNLYYVEMTMEDVEAYNTLLESEGWDLNDAVNGLMYAYSKGNHQLNITVTEDEEGRLLYGMFLIENGMMTFDDDSGTGNDAHNGEAEDGLGYLVGQGQSILAGFPQDEIPIFKDAELIMVQEIPYEDDKSAYSLMYVSSTDFNTLKEAVVELYENQFGNQMAITDMGEFTILMGESDNYTYTVTLSKSNDETYPVDLQYLVDVK